MQLDAPSPPTVAHALLIIYTYSNHALRVDNAVLWAGKVSPQEVRCATESGR